VATCGCFVPLLFRKNENFRLRLWGSEKECSRDVVNHGLHLHELFFCHCSSSSSLKKFFYLGNPIYPSEYNCTRITRIRLIQDINRSDMILNFQIRIESDWDDWIWIWPKPTLAHPYWEWLVTWSWWLKEQEATSALSLIPNFEIGRCREKWTKQRR